ncbi:MAG TPA: CotH kinase family protein [Candidatus Dormibacteraeota bacterium]|nr:CotH kinase family protein [Candidatus Dormibacteraeota bacterium]
MISGRIARNSGRAVGLLGFLAVLVLAGLADPKAWAVTRPDSSSAVPEPKFSVHGGVFTNEISLELSANPASSVIRYTLDGSEPTSQSTKYSSPLHISESTLVKAKVFVSDSSTGPTATEAYSLMEPGLAAFSSNLPLILLDTFGERVPFGRKIPVQARFVDTRTGRSTLLGSPDFEGLGELNVRGHTSLRYPKHSYHFQTKNDGEGRKVALLGLPKESDWVLYAPYPDKSLMRDVLGYELSNQIGRYAARTRFVEVFLNDSHGRLTKRNYLGVYVFEEKIKRGKNRVDIQKLTPEDNTEPNISGGYIIKKDHSDQVDNPDDSVPMSGGSPGRKEASFRSKNGGQFFYVEPKGDQITPEQKAWLRGYINRFERVLYGDDFKDPKNGYAAFIDPDSFIDHHLLVELSKNIDGFRFSTFYYKDRGGRLNMGPIWDWNLSFGNANSRDGVNPEGWYWSQLDDRQYSWFRRLFEDPDFAQRYVDRWGELRAKQFTIIKLMARIDELAASLEESQARNFHRWPVLGRHVWPNAFVGKTFSEEIDFLKQWTRQRVEWMDQELMFPPLLSMHEGTIRRGAKLELHSRQGKVYYTLDGSDPRSPGGAVSKRAKLYNSKILLNETTTVCCRVSDGSRWSYPVTGKFVIAAAASEPNR